LFLTCQVPDDQKASSQSTAVNSGGVGVYGFAVPLSPPQQHQHVMSASPHQQHSAQAFVASQPVLASASLVLVPADSLSAQPASAPVLWQVSSTNSQPALPIATDNPAFFRVAVSSTAAAGSSLPIFDVPLQAMSQPLAPQTFAANFNGRMQPVGNVLPASAAEYIMHNVSSGQLVTQPVDMVTAMEQSTTLRNASSIPDIVLTGRLYYYYHHHFYS